MEAGGPGCRCRRRWVKCKLIHQVIWGVRFCCFLPLSLACCGSGAMVVMVVQGGRSRRGIVQPPSRPNTASSLARVDSLASLPVSAGCVSTVPNSTPSYPQPCRVTQLMGTNPPVSRHADPTSTRQRRRGRQRNTSSLPDETPCVRACVSVCECERCVSACIPPPSLCPALGQSLGANMNSGESHAAGGHGGTCGFVRSGTPCCAPLPADQSHPHRPPRPIAETGRRTQHARGVAFVWGGRRGLPGLVSLAANHHLHDLSWALVYLLSFFGHP